MEEKIVLKTKWPKWLSAVFIVVCMALLILGGYMVYRYCFHLGISFKDNATGQKISVAIADANEQKPISNSGGELTINISNSSKASINFPANSLPSSEIISAKKIGSLTGLDNNFQFVTGLELSPDGTLLDEPAELKLPIPAEFKDKNIIGFSYATDGVDFHLYPIKIENEEAILKLNGFSGYGILVFNDGAKSPAAPTTVQRQAEQLIAIVIAEAKITKGELNKADQDKITNILRAWYKTSIRPNLKSAANNSDLIDGAIHEFTSFRVFAQMLGVEDRMNSEVEEGLNLIAAAIKSGSEKDHQACVNDKDAKKAGKLLRAIKLTQLLGLDGRAGLSEKNISELVDKCVRFELSIKSYDLLYFDGGTSYDGATGNVSIVSKDQKLSGSGEITIDQVGITGDLPCTSSAPETTQLTIPEFNIVSSSGSDKLSLVLQIGIPPDVTWDCSAEIQQYSSGSSITEGNQYWNFDMFHQDLAISEDQFLINDWEIVNSDGVFARKVYDRPVSVNYYGHTNSYHENTTLELIHKPIM